MTSVKNSNSLFAIASSHEMETSLEERQFLFCAMGHGIMSTDVAFENFLKCKDETRAATINEMDELIKQINQNISEFDQKIEKFRYELNKSVFYIYINTSESLVNRFQSHLAQPDIHYFRLLLKEIALSESGHSITGLQASNICSKVPQKPITKVHGEILLEEWCRMGYFYNDNGLILYGPRMIVEFSHFLKTNYPNNIHACKLCHQVVFGSEKCNECGEDFHRECIRKYLIRGKNCPECKKTWLSSLDDLNSQEAL